MLCQIGGRTGRTSQFISATVLASLSCLRTSTTVGATTLSQTIKTSSFLTLPARNASSSSSSSSPSPSQSSSSSSSSKDQAAIPSPAATAASAQSDASNSKLNGPKLHSIIEFGSLSKPFANLLNGVRDRADIDYFMRHFGNRDVAEQIESSEGNGKQIAVIKIGGAVVEEEMETFAPALSFLYRIGVAPVVIHGGGPQLNKLLEAAGVVPEYIDGMRVTDPETLKIAQQVFNEANQKVCEGLRKVGVPAAPCTSGVLSADIIDYNKWKLVGRTTGANRKTLMSHVTSGKVPVITSLAQDKSGQTLNINADIAACEVAKAVLPFTTVFLNSTGGIPGEKGKIIEQIDLHAEYDHLMAQPWVKYGTRLKIKEFKELLDALPNQSSVTITSTGHLTRSLLFGRCTNGTTVFGSPKKNVNAASTRSFATSARSKAEKLGVGIVGARGFVGKELIKLLEAHSGLELRCVGSRANAGQKVRDSIPEYTGELTYSSLPPSEISNASASAGIDCWVLAMPNNQCDPYVQAIRALPTNPNRKVVTIDLSADYRFSKDWQYGQPERFRNEIKSASFISNPGCYATGAQLSVLPLLPYIDSANAPSIFGVSGYSGAGTSPSEKNDVNYLADNLIPYSLIDHMHEREVSHQLGVKVHFSPHVAQFFQGITLTSDIRLKSGSNMTRDKAISLFRAMYDKEPLLDVLQDKIPVVKDNSGKHFVRFGGFSVSKSGDRVVVVCTLDNLLKGAATQALQNINLALGFNELDGIQVAPFKEKK